MAGPTEQLQRLYASRLLQRPGGIGAGEFNALSPEMKMFYIEGRQQIEPGSSEDYVRVFVTNCPVVYLQPGKVVQLFAMPTGTHTFVDTQNQPQSIARYDYGEPVVGKVPAATNLFLVTAQGIMRVKKETTEEAASKKTALAANLIAWQREQASNDVANVQYDLAKRYLAGDGVTKDDSLGHYWLERSAAQHYEPANKLLEALAGAKRND